MDSWKEISEFQAELSRTNNSGIIGLTYVIECYIGNNFESVFHCVLCDEQYDFQMIIAHLTTPVHRMNYLKKHFLTAHDEISKLEKREQKHYFLEKVCRCIEDNYGRLSPLIVENSEFSKNKLKFVHEALRFKHIDENMGKTFDEIFTERNSKDYADTDFNLDQTTQSNDSTSPNKSADVISLSSSPSSPNEKPHSSGDARANYKRSPEYDDKRGYRSKSRSYNSQYKSSQKSQARPRSRSRSSHRRLSPEGSSRKSQQLSPRTSNSYRRNNNSSSSRSHIPHIPPHTHETPNESTLTPVYHGGSHSTLADLMASLNDDPVPVPSTSGRELFQMRKPSKSSVDENKPVPEIEEPITVMSVLGLLAAFEDILGSLGGEVIELMTKAIIMNKAEANSSNVMLDNHEHSIIFEKIYEKLKGLLNAGSIERKKLPAVRKLIENMTTLMCEANDRKKTNTQSATEFPIAKEENSSSGQSSYTNVYDRAAIAAKFLEALAKHGRKEEDISQVELENFIDAYIIMANAKQHSDTGTPSQAVKPKTFATTHAPEVLPVSSVKMFNTGNENQFTNRYANVTMPDNFSSTDNYVSMANTKQHSDVDMKPSATSMVRTVHQPPEVLPVSYVKVENAGKENQLTNRHDKVSMLDEFSTPVISDHELKTLTENFTTIDDKSKRCLINYLKSLGETDPQRMKRFNDMLMKDIHTFKCYTALNAVKKLGQ